MTEAEWLECEDPIPMLNPVRSKRSDRKLRLLVVACCRGVWHGLRDIRSRTAVEVSERFADGHATLDELGQAYEEAYIAVDSCGEPPLFSEDQAIAANLAAAANVDEERERENPDPAYVAIHALGYAIDGTIEESKVKQATLLRDIFGNPFRPVAFDPNWRTSDVVAMARGMYETRDFAAMPILADALQDAGCEHADVLEHCRGTGPHVRGCWVVDLILGKE